VATARKNGPRKTATLENVLACLRIAAGLLIQPDSEEKGVVKLGPQQGCTIAGLVVSILILVAIVVVIATRN
jgi:preprotein translocase subunit Sec61beta